MRKIWIVAIVLLMLPALLPAAQAPQGAPAGGGPPAGAGRGAGARGPAAPATIPLPRDDARHKSFLDIAAKGNIDLLFVGDSITDFWANRGKAVWDATFGTMKTANFGISGDTTQGVLWRMQNGELDGFKAKLIILMLGTNNINRNPNDDIVEGDRLIVEEFKKRQPQAKVLILGIFPRVTPAGSSYRDGAFRAPIQEINSKLAKFADNKQVFYMDLADKFLSADGTLAAELFADGLHPTLPGYQIWADSTMSRVKELMK